ncbi:hypothetical protein [Pontibacter arcticus]|uniref:hypothetical protein n=1 Tax=Pontibacter arcticus TaxID=2080288 RepID=UPI001402A6ED|nr:hypothetical protein [Pontibacter arcticus]
MQKRKLELPEELKYVNRMKWGYESPDENPKQVCFAQQGDQNPKIIKVYNFFGYSFSES